MTFQKSFFLQRGLLVALGLILLGAYTLIATMGTAHASGGPVSIQAHTCSDDPNDEHCNGQDPISTFCNRDAHTVISQRAWRNGVQVGYVDLRMSKQCNSYWVRGLGFAFVGVRSVHAAIQFPVDVHFGPGSTELAPNSVLMPDGSVQVYTDMSYRQRPPTSSTYAVFGFSDGTELTVNV